MGPFPDNRCGVRFIFHSWSDHLSLQTNSSEDEPVPLADRGPVPYIVVDPTANKEKIMSQDNVPVWFITGCSTGFGREIAQQVLDRGWRAVVTARDPGQVRDIVAGRKDAALALVIRPRRCGMTRTATSPEYQAPLYENSQLRRKTLTPSQFNHNH